MDWTAIIMALLQALPTLISQVTAIIDQIIAIFNQQPPTPATNAAVQHLEGLKKALTDMATERARNVRP